jgi:hypothetical protein
MFEPWLLTHGYFHKRKERALEVCRATTGTIWGIKVDIFEADHQLIHQVPLAGNRAIT